MEFLFEIIRLKKVFGTVDSLDLKVNWKFVWPSLAFWVHWHKFYLSSKYLVAENNPSKKKEFTSMYDGVG